MPNSGSVNVSSPWTVNRTSLAPNNYLLRRTYWYGSNGVEHAPNGNLVYQPSSTWYETHTLPAGLGWNSYRNNYYDWLVTPVTDGWGIHYGGGNRYDLIGASGNRIFTNGTNGAILNYSGGGGGNLGISWHNDAWGNPVGDQVYVNANGVTVTVDRGGYGRIDAVSGGIDNFILDASANGYTSLYTGDQSDHITVNSGHNYVHAGTENDNITISSTNNTAFGGANKDTVAASGDYNTVYGGGNGYLSTDTNDEEDQITVANHSYVQGDNKADQITATDFNTIYGDSNKYDPSGYGGKDTITARNSNYVYGGNDADSILVNDSNHVEGNNGSDNIAANDENTIWGGADKDTIFASEYNTVYGGGSGSNADNDMGTDVGGQADSADSIKVEVGNLVYGGDGEDVIEAESANLIFGGEGKDTITAAAKDSIGGGDGEDCIKAGEHAYIDAGPDNDNVEADFNSSVWGAGGNDTIHATDTSYIDGGDNIDSIIGSNDSTIKGGWDKDNIEAIDGNIIYGDYDENNPGSTFSITHSALQSLVRTNSGSAGNDTVTAKNLNTIYGGYGDDSVVATDLNIVYGGHNRDSLNLRSYNTISGGEDEDTILASDFNLIYGDKLRDGFDPGAGDDSIVARTDSTIYGGAGKDTIIADDAAKIDGGTGNDSISFGMNSSILAGEGDDTIVSQAPGSPTAPNGSNGSTIWGGKGKVDKFNHPIHYETSGGIGTDGTGTAFTAKSPGVHDAHGHNVFTGEDALVTIMDFKFGNDVIHFGKAFEASAVTAFGYGNSTIVPTTDYQIYTAGTDRVNVAATISDAANIDMRDETGKFVMFGNPNGTLKGGFANTLLGGKNDDTIYVGEGDYVYGGLGNDTINLNGYNNWRDHVGLTEEGGTDTITSFQQGWGEGDDVVWYNVPLRKQVVDDKGNAMTDADHRPIYTDTNTDAVADLNDANVRVVGDKTVLNQGKSKLILNGVTHGEILMEDGEGVHRTALLGDGYYNDSTRGGQIFIGRKEYSDIVSFEKNNHDLVVDLGMTKRFKDKSAKFYSIEQAIGGSGNNTLVGAKNVRNTLEGGVGTSSIWGGGISADLMVSGTGSATDHYTTFFYGTGDGDDTIEGFRTTERTEAHFKRDILNIHSGDVTSVRKVGTSIVLNMSGRTDRLTIRNAASGLFDQLIEVNVMGKKGAAKVTGANEVVTYDPHAQYYFSNAKSGGTVRNFGDNSRIYLDGRTGDVYKGITNIDVSAGSRLELAGDASNNRIIYRGTGTASLYGGLGNDTMTGSKDGMNRFFFGRSDGNDVITNSTVNDKVMLYDVALEEVVSAKETNGTMRIALKSGARLAIQNFDAKSVHDFTLATGDTWVYNHNATGTGGYWSPKGNYPVQPKA